MSIVTLDCDDTLLDFVTPFFAWHNQAYGTSLRKRDLKDYKYHLLFGVSEEEGYARVYEFLGSQYYADLPAIPGAQRLINTLQKKAELVIVTARRASAQTLTQKNLEARFGVQFPNIVHINSEDSNVPYTTKAAACVALGARVLIDDNHEHAVFCAEQKMPVILYQQPWNRTKIVPGALRARNHTETVAHALNFLENHRG